MDFLSFLHLLSERYDNREPVSHRVKVTPDLKYRMRIKGNEMKT